MNRTVIATTARFATTALLLAASLMYVSRSFGQDATPAAALSNQPANELGKLEFQLRSNPPESRSFGQASGAYWKLIGDTKDFPRAYSFFAELNDAAPAPQPTLLASKASATGTYISWLYQNSLQEQAGDATMQKLLDDSIAEYKQALAIDPENFAALYGYAFLRDIVLAERSTRKSCLQSSTPCGRQSPTCRGVWSITWRRRAGLSSFVLSEKRLLSNEQPLVLCLTLNGCAIQYVVHRM